MPNKKWKDPVKKQLDPWACMMICITILLIGMIIVAIIEAVRPSKRIQHAMPLNTAQSKPIEENFDHANCQYPFRTTNPANGCDNSDPCDPASAVKGGSGDCAS